VLVQVGLLREGAGAVFADERPLACVRADVGLQLHLGLPHNVFCTIFSVLWCLVWWPGQYKRIAPLSIFHGCRKGLIAFTPEIDCDQTAMGLPPVTSATHS
jgi:hypothetical protein